MNTVAEDIAGPLFNLADALRLGATITNEEILAAFLDALRVGHDLATRMDAAGVWLDSELVAVIARTGAPLVDELICRRPEPAAPPTGTNGDLMLPAQVAGSAFLQTLRELHVADRYRSDQRLWWTCLTEIVNGRPPLDGRHPGAAEPELTLDHLQHGCVSVLQGRPDLAIPHLVYALETTGTAPQHPSETRTAWFIGAESHDPETRRFERTMLLRATVEAVVHDAAERHTPHRMAALQAYLQAGFPALHPAEVRQMRAIAERYQRAAISRMTVTTEPIELRFERN